MNTIMKQDVQFWNDLYETKEEYDPAVALENETLEDALNWLSEKGSTILDIGSGDGKMVLRTLHKGALKIIGLDSSYHGISLARRSAQAHFSTLKTKWLWGNLGSLAALPDGCASGIILSGILECLTQEEGAYVVSHCERLLDQGGKVLVLATSEEELTLLASYFKTLEEMELQLEDAFGIKGNSMKVKVIKMIQA